MSRLLLILSIVLGSCGGNGTVPDVADATIDADFCECPSAAQLLAEQIMRDSVTVYTNLGLGTTFGCIEGYLMSVGCTITVNDPGLALVEAGINSTNPDGCTCDWYWYNPTLQKHADLTTTAVCLQASNPPQAGNMPEGCECPPVEPLLERVYRVQLSQGLPAEDHTSLSASCLEDDAVVVAGGCSLEPSPLNTLEPYIKLSQSGLVADEWRCSWDNATLENSFTITTTAVCIRPPTPGTAPEDERIADRVLYVAQEKTLPANTTLAFSAACAPGDYLISGSCTLDATTGDAIALYHHGFEPGGNNPNAWRCAWSNPTDATPTARATAICLTPPAL